MNPDAIYIALIGDPKRLQGLRRLQYRCETARCLILDAIDIGPDVVLHQKRYKYSPEKNAARSSESGRRANTYDGDRRWRAHSYFIGSSALAHPEDNHLMHLGLTCDHIVEYRLQPAEFHEDLAAGRAEVRVRHDGTRFVVR